MGRSIFTKLRLVFATLAVVVIPVTPAVSAPSAPVLVGPSDGDTVSFLPVFSWNSVSRADKDNFVLAAGPLCTCAVYSLLGTKNPRATPDKTLPNGTYWCRVQAVDSAGNTSPWSSPDSIEKP